MMSGDEGGRGDDEACDRVAPVAAQTDVNEVPAARTAPGSRAERVGDWLTGWADRFPSRLQRLLPREMVGFVILGTFTFLVDLGLLYLLEHTTRLPLGASVSAAYVVAFWLNYLLNRVLNFRSHAPVGPQVFKYGVVVATDYGLTVSVTTALAVDFRIARVVAACCVGVFSFIACRFWVFRDVLERA